MLLTDLEMALVRDAVWSAVQEFRLPNEDQLLDRLYHEFGDEPFAILLPRSDRRADSAPFFESGRDVLRGTLSKFLASDDWGEWMDAQRQTPSRPRRAPPPPPADPPPATQSNGRGADSLRTDEAPAPAAWDGWD